MLLGGSDGLKIEDKYQRGSQWAKERERRSKKQSESTIEIAFLKTLLIFDPTLPFKYLEILKEEKEYMVL